MCTSASTVPGSPNVSVDNILNSSISLSWSIPSDSVVTSYEVEWRSEDCPEDVDEDNDTTNDTSYTIDDLRAGTAYNITVSASNSVGMATADKVAAETDELGESTTPIISCHFSLYFLPSAPSAAPNAVMVTMTTDTTITLQWGEVDCTDHNGEITGYSVTYGVEGSDSPQTMDVPGDDVTETTIQNLMSSTTYSIEVAAVNSAGTGPYGDSITAETDGITHNNHAEDLLYDPFSYTEAILSISFTSSTTTSLTVSWTLADNVTATNYTISYSNTNNTECFTDSDTITVTPDSESDTMYTVTGLEEGTEYSITVTATLNGGRTGEDNNTATTNAAG